MDFPAWNEVFRRLRVEASTQAPAIALRGFMDLDLDVVGVYAIGHHPSAAFLAAARQFEPLLVAHPERFRYSWAEIKGNQFEEVYPWHEQAQPITLVELCA
ncbi:MAG TPA: hypothetical protein V6D07_08390 [Trichocoleus sp.]